MTEISRSAKAAPHLLAQHVLAHMRMTEDESTDWHLDRRLPIALIFAIAVQTGAGLIWAGAAGERIRQLEDQGLMSRDMSERLVRVEEQIGFARQTLARIERKLDTPEHGDDE